MISNIGLVESVSYTQRGFLRDNRSAIPPMLHLITNIRADTLSNLTGSDTRRSLQKLLHTLSAASMDILSMKSVLNFVLVMARS